MPVQPVTLRRRRRLSARPLSLQRGVMTIVMMMKKILSIGSPQPRTHFLPLSSRVCPSSLLCPLALCPLALHPLVLCPYLLRPLTARDVKSQVDASFGMWLSQLEKSIVTIADNSARVTIAPLCDELKALRSQGDATASRQEIWHEKKMLCNVDRIDKKTDACSSAVAKLMWQVKQLEAGTQNQYDQVDLTVEAPCAPSFSSAPSLSSAPSSSLKRSLETAELGNIDVTLTRLARVETNQDTIMKLLSSLSTPGLSSSSAPSSARSSSFQSSPNYYAPPQCEDFAARMAAYFQEEDRKLEEKQREKRRQAALGLSSRGHVRPWFA
jgi:hypothetical protein